MLIKTYRNKLKQKDEQISKLEKQLNSQEKQLGNKEEDGVCVFSGKPSKQRVLFAMAYWSNKYFKGNIVNGGSLEITLTVPLSIKSL